MSHSPLSTSPTKIRRQSQLIAEPKQYKNNEIQDLLESEALSGSEKDLILRVYEAAEKLRIWCQEIDEWGWTGTFEDTGMRDEPLDDSDFSVEHESLWEKREERLNSIASALDRMELDELKARVWRMHSQNASHERYRSDEQEERPVAMYSDFELFATQMIVQTLPDLEILRHALRSWSLRLIVFQEMDAYFRGLEETRQWRKEAEVYISADHMQEVDVRNIDEIMTGLEVCRTNLEKQIAELGVQLDKMLDALETSDDTLPEDWIDEFEDLEHFYGDWVAQAEAKLLELQVRKVKLEKLQRAEGALRAREMAENGDLEDRFTAIEQRLESVAPDLDQQYAANFTPRIVNPANNILDTSSSLRSGQVTRVGSGLSSTPSNARATSMDNTSMASIYHDQYDGASDTSVDATFRRYSVADDAESFKLGLLDFEGDDHEFSFMLPEDHFEVDLSDLDDDFDYSTLLDSPASSEPGSPIGGWDDTPSIPRIRPIAKAQAPPLNALITKRRSIDQDSLAPFQSIRAAPLYASKHAHHLTPIKPATNRTANKSGRANKSPSLPFQEHLSELVNSLPTPIHLVTSRADSLSPISTTQKDHDQISHAVRTPHDRVPSLLRAFENARSTPPSAAQNLPALTLTAVETRRRTRGPSDIRIYHLSAPGKEKPIKLFIRRIGENNERLMVRVGGGWADLGEYLRAYAAHHLSSMGMDVRDLEQTKPDNSQANGKHQRDVSNSTTVSADETLSTHVDEPSELHSELIETSTPKDTHSTIQFTPDLTQRSQTPTSFSDSHRRITPYSNEQVSSKPVSLAGPVAFKRAQKQEMNSEKKEWVKGIVEQARRTVSGSYGQNNAANVNRNARAATPLGSSSPAIGSRDSAERSSSRLSGQFRRLSIEGVHGEKSRKLWLRTKD